MEDELQITLTNDYAFKRLLGSEENKPLLQQHVFAHAKTSLLHGTPAVRGKFKN